MSWVKVDDGAGENRKLTAVSAEAHRLWFDGLCYCARQLTDGVIHVRQLPRLTTGDWKALAAELTTPQVEGKAPLWELAEDGQSVRVHDYLEYNPPAAEVLSGRTAAKERMRAVRAQRQEQSSNVRANNSRTFGRTTRERSSERLGERSEIVREKFSDPVPSPSRPNKQKEPPVVPRKRGTAASPGLLDDLEGGTARWAATAKRPKHVTPRDLEAAVVRCLREIRQETVYPDKSATSAAAVLSLWRAIGNLDVYRFADELVLVARAAQMSGDKIFARDIRAEGWPEGTDRTFHVTTICRHDKWDDRLRAAAAWARGSGRAGEGGVARARRVRWFDPGDPSAWKVHDEPVPLFRMYLDCARRLFEDELAGEALQGALAKMEAMDGLKGSSAEVSAVVRLAIDEVGHW